MSKTGGGNDEGGLSRGKLSVFVSGGLVPLTARFDVAARETLTAADATATMELNYRTTARMTACHTSREFYDVYCTVGPLHSIVLNSAQVPTSDI